MVSNMQTWLLFFNFLVSKVWQSFPNFQHLRKNYSSQKSAKTSQIFVVVTVLKICQIKHTLIIALVFVRFCHITDWTKGQTCTQQPLLYFQEGLGLVCKRTQKLRLLPVNLCQFCSPVILHPPDISLEPITRLGWYVQRLIKRERVLGIVFLMQGNAYMSIYY